ncbi:laminin G domain-containing protein [Halorubrum tailed virus 25]|uniref:Laminin G domain-containing protein n=1 Tax=Halorubrum tailed virus 25 TaxID=2878006 RepID=A0AAE8Y120_9CAUD|nr:laminin G domain-containing protein [Halorubrum tailed virus 25]UBF22588.1 laminin G domain-containing protein [Halorubrum tailed virus 25]
MKQIAETGSIYIDGNYSNIPNAADSDYVSFSQLYDRPVVIAHQATNSGGQDVDNRVTNLTSSGFDLFAHEPDRQGHANNWHTWICVEEGVWQTADGAIIEAGVHQTETTNEDGEAFTGDSVEFEYDWATAPVVLSTPNTHNNQDWATIGIENVTATGFDVAQQQGGTTSTNNATASEELAYIAISPGSGTLDSGVPYEASLTTSTSTTFGVSFSGAPDIVCDWQERPGSSCGWVRGGGTWTSTDHNWYIESAGSSGTYGYLAIEPDSTINGTNAATNRSGGFSYRGTDPKSLAYFPLNGTTGEVWQDSQTAAYGVTSTTGPDGSSNGAYQFASGDYIAIDNFDFAGFRPEFSISAWFKTSSSNGIIASHDRSEHYRLGVGSSGPAGYVTFNVDTDAGVADVNGNTRVDDGEWHFVVATYDNGSIKIYLDGELDYSGSKGTQMGDSTNRYGFIGTGSEAGAFDGSRGPDEWWVGSIAALRMANYAPTEAEIAELYAESPNYGYDGLNASDTAKGTGGTYSGTLTVNKSVKSASGAASTASSSFTAGAATATTTTASRSSSTATDTGSSVATATQMTVNTTGVASTELGASPNTATVSDAVLDGALTFTKTGFGTTKTAGSASVESAFTAQFSSEITATTATATVTNSSCAAKAAGVSTNTTPTTSRPVAATTPGAGVAGTVTVASGTPTTSGASTAMASGTTAQTAAGIPTPVEADNLLTNASFEADPLDNREPTGWVYPIEDAWEITSDYTAPGSQGGKSFGSRYKNDSGVRAEVWPDAYFYQDVDVSGGETLQATAWVRSGSWTDNNWTGPDPNLQYVYEDDTRLHFEYYDLSDTLIGSDRTRWMGDAKNRGLDYLTYVTGSWFYFDYEISVPNNAAYVRFQFDGGDANNGYIDPETGHGGNAGMWVDDVRLFNASPRNSVETTTAGSGLEPAVAGTAVSSPSTSVVSVGTPETAQTTSGTSTATTSVVGPATASSGTAASIESRSGLTVEASVLPAAFSPSPVTPLIGNTGGGIVGSGLTSAIGIGNTASSGGGKVSSIAAGSDGATQTSTTGAGSTEFGTTNTVGGQTTGATSASLVSNSQTASVQSGASITATSAATGGAAVPVTATPSTSVGGGNVVHSTASSFSLDSLGAAGSVVVSDGVLVSPIKGTADAQTTAIGSVTSSTCEVPVALGLKSAIGLSVSNLISSSTKIGSGYRWAYPGLENPSLETGPRVSTENTNTDAGSVRTSLGGVAIADGGTTTVGGGNEANALASPVLPSPGTSVTGTATAASVSVSSKTVSGFANTDSGGLVSVVSSSKRPDIRIGAVGSLAASNTNAVSATTDTQTSAGGVITTEASGNVSSAVTTVSGTGSVSSTTNQIGSGVATVSGVGAISGCSAGVLASTGLAESVSIGGSSVSFVSALSAVSTTATTGYGVEPTLVKTKFGTATTTATASIVSFSGALTSPVVGDPFTETLSRANVSLMSGGGYGRIDPITSTTATSVTSVAKVALATVDSITSSTGGGTVTGTADGTTGFYFVGWRGSTITVNEDGVIFSSDSSLVDTINGRTDSKTENSRNGATIND